MGRLSEILTLAQERAQALQLPYAGHDDADRGLKIRAGRPWH